MMKKYWKRFAAWAIESAPKSLSVYPAKHAAISEAKLISDVAHDLRNSLASMKLSGEVYLLRNDDITPEEFRSFIEGELKELDRMQKTIERLSAPAPASSSSSDNGT